MHTTYRNNWKNLVIISFIFTLSFFKSTNLKAFVSVINGNYSVSFVDITHPQSRQEYQLKVSRTYNSKSQYDGIFGYGWGSEFESFLIVSADGTVVINESGGGEKTRFAGNLKPRVLNVQIKRLVNAKIEKMKKEGKAFSNTEIKAYTAKLQKDADFRDEEGRTLKITPKLPQGTTLYSVGRVNKQKIQVLSDGFLRIYGDNRKVYFRKKVRVSDLGLGINQRRTLEAYKITRIENPTTRLLIKFAYDVKGNLKSITSGNQALYFSLDSNKKVIQARNTAGQIAKYEYCPAEERYNASKKCGPDDLIKSIDTAGNTYAFEYDNAHNLTKLTTKKADSKLTHTEQISYWPLAPPGAFQPGSGGVKKRTFRTGMEKSYTYWADPKNPRLHTKTNVTTTRKNGTKSEASYEFWRKRRQDGSLYKHRTVSNVRNVITETIYNSCCGQPIKITKGKAVTTFQYYPGSQLLKQKSDPREVKNWVYSNKHFGKPVKITIKDKKTNLTRQVSFGFNKRGNLRHAKTSDGKSISIAYDNRNRMKVLVDHKKRRILLNYNASSKPELIQQQGVGSIRLIYDKNSEKVKNFKVEKGDSRTAFNIAYAFQDALKIIKFAGIEPI